MRTHHLFGEGYYFVCNKAVSKSFMFADEADSDRFKVGIQKHLSPLCEVLSFGFSEDEFQLIVRLRPRKVFENYYRLKNEDSEYFDGFIPETTYIFAQAMANLQSGYAKYFNYKYERDGSLMKGRYGRERIDSEEELGVWIDRVHDLRPVWVRRAIWTFRKSGFGVSSKELYVLQLRDLLLTSFRRMDELCLRGQFDNLPPLVLEFKNRREKVKNLVSFILLRGK